MKSEYNPVNTTKDDEPNEPNKDIKSDSSHDTYYWSCKYSIICICVFILIINIFILIHFILSESGYNDEQNSSNIYAYFHRRNYNNGKTICDSLYLPDKNIYGCCHIIDRFNIRYNISYSNNICRDKDCSNCPSYNYLLTKYSEHVANYPSYYGVINCIIHKCCKINNVTIPVRFCPNTGKIINTYDYGFSNPWISLIILMIIILIALCCLLA
jgi:hypothetical protein